jgi:hypothetical protein
VIFIYWLFGIILGIIFIWAAISTIKISHLLQNLVESGVLANLKIKPKVSTLKSVKEEARLLISSGSKDYGKISELIESLNGFPYDKEALELKNKLEQMEI